MTEVVVIGLGYVGLPLSLEMSKFLSVTGYDVNAARVRDLQSGSDVNGEVDRNGLLDSSLKFTTNVRCISHADFIIVTVPTPILKNENPDLAFIESASIMIGENLKRGAIVVFESTVYPGTTEEICKPLIEKASGMTCGVDFELGYSPERINPGEVERPVSSIRKIVSGSSPQALMKIGDLYDLLLDEPSYRCTSIKVAEAAKVLENTQRDVNIALMNEFAVFANSMNLCTHDIIEAASTKWNFLKFYPGLVGGHCIGVDPYYLIHKAKEVNIDFSLVRTARKINEGVAFHIVKTFIKKHLSESSNEVNKNILIIGCTFKENCPDIRNSKVFDVIENLSSFGYKIDIFDPIANLSHKPKHIHRNLKDLQNDYRYSGVFYCVPHDKVKEEVEKFIEKKIGEGAIVFDVRSQLRKSENIISL